MVHLFFIIKGTEVQKCASVPLCNISAFARFEASAYLLLPIIQLRRLMPYKGLWLLAAVAACRSPG